MKITVRAISGGKKYSNVSFEHLGTEVDMGFFDARERIELADHLKDVIEDLLYNLEVVE